MGTLSPAGSTAENPDSLAIGRPLAAVVVVRDSSRMLHETYFPFTDAQLRTHFAPISGDEHVDADRHLAYYRTSLARLADHLQAGSASDPRATKRARQVEKDERFWIVAALMALHHGQSRVRAYGELMKRSGVRPPGQSRARS